MTIWNKISLWRQLKFCFQNFPLDVWNFFKLHNVYLILQANNSLALAGMKLGLLRMSLEYRLNELPPNDAGDRVETLRHELRDSNCSPTLSYIYSRSNSVIRTNQYLTVAKPAAITGTLSIRCD